MMGSLMQHEPNQRFVADDSLNLLKITALNGVEAEHVVKIEFDDKRSASRGRFCVQTSNCATDGHAGHMRFVALLGYSDQGAGD